MTSVMVSSGQRWELGEVIGSGGAGRVHVATSGASEPHVIKLVSKSGGSFRELLVARDLYGVPNIVPVLDTGQTESDWALLMPRAERSLRNYIDEIVGPIGEGEALVILLDVASALAGLTQIQTRGGGIGVIHRDLKPENVLFLNGAWCVSDFGIARYVDRATARDTRRYFMTPDYAAPEQWRGETATPSTDVYAFGVIAFELLKGARPFNGTDLRQQHLTVEASSVKGISPTLAALVVECLYKHAGTRPTPDRLLKRLEGEVRRPGFAGVGSVGGGVSALQAANIAETARRGQSAWQTQQDRDQVRERAELFRVAAVQWKQISGRLRSTILEHAPTCNVDRAGDKGWQLQLSEAAIVFTEPVEHKCMNDSRFDVIAQCYVAVGSINYSYYNNAFSNKYSGRAHSLWFCNAQEKDRYLWYELAFYPRSQGESAERRGYLWGGGGGRRVDVVQSSYAPAATLPRVSSFGSKLAWPLTPLAPEELGDFLDRWANWFADASTGSLPLKISGADYAKLEAPPPPPRRARLLRGH